MDESGYFDQMEENAQKAIDHATHEFGNINTGKANPGMVEAITVDAYGSQMKIKEMAAISTPDMRTIAITPWDRSLLKAVEKAILAANLGITPTVMGDTVRLPLPELTGERRQELVKLAHKHAEDSRVRVRNARRDAIDGLKKLQKAGDISEDDLKSDEKEIQTITDNAIKSIGELLAKKEKDLTTV